MLNHQDRLFNLLDGMEMTKSEHDWLELRFANMTEKERLLFTGALELERPTQADRVMELANQLPCFDLYYSRESYASSSCRRCRLRTGPRKPSSSSLSMAAAEIFMFICRLYLAFRSPSTFTKAQKDFLLEVQYLGTSAKG